MSDSLKDFEATIREQSSREGSESLSEDRITLLVIRQLVAEHRLAEEEMDAELQSYFDNEGGDLKESTTWPEYDEASHSAGVQARDNWAGLIRKLEELLP